MTLIIILLIFLCLYRYILIILMYPLVALDQYRIRLSEQSKNSSKTNGKACGFRYKYLFIKFLDVPYYVVGYTIFRGGIIRYIIYQIGLIPSHHIRKFMYEGLGASVGKNVVFHFRAELRSPEKLIIGKGTIIGDNAILDARKGLEIGDNVNLSSNVSIYTLQHDYRDPDFGCTQTKDMKVTIGDRAWLGSNVIVLPGVHIGEGAVCCAGCVVTKNVEPYAVVAGIPARKISERPQNLRYNFDGKSCRLY